MSPRSGPPSHHSSRTSPDPVLVGKSFFWPALVVGLGVILGVVSLLYLQHAVEPERSSVGEASPQPKRTVASGNGFSGVETMTSAEFAADSSRISQRNLPAEDEQPQQPWEKAINQLLDSDDANDKVATELAAIAPTLPLEGQVEAIQHMVNLLDDEQYALAQNMLLNPSLHPDLREVIFSDTLDRPNSVKLPMLLALFGSPGHPLRAQAHTNLQSVIGRDLGQDPGLWTQAIQQVLAQEAEEEVEAEEQQTLEQ